MRVDNGYMRMMLPTEESVNADEFGAYMESEQNVCVVPRGRVGGLFGALAGAICRIDDVRALPATAVHELRSCPPMFDYDPTLAVLLDV